jgi:hypothetical protein
MHVCLADHLPVHNITEAPVELVSQASVATFLLLCWFRIFNINVIITQANHSLFSAEGYYDSPIVMTGRTPAQQRDRPN